MGLAEDPRNGGTSHPVVGRVSASVVLVPAAIPELTRLRHLGSIRAVPVEHLSNDAIGHLVEIGAQRGAELLELGPQRLIDEGLGNPTIAIR